MKQIFRLMLVLAVLATGLGLRAAERIPPVPPRYFNDYTGTISGPTATALNAQLEQYERESSNQLLVAIYPKMESDSSVEDYTVRVAQAWKVGQKGKSNGAVLFVFKNDRKLYIQVGYGLEATLTDATAHDIVENILKPRFRQGNFDAGLQESVAAMIAATKGEYRGTGRTRAEGYQPNRTRGGIIALVATLFIVFVIVQLLRHGVRQPTVIGGRRRAGLGNVFWTGGGGGWSGGSGGWSGGGGGGFSGGGGSFGGGGAGGSW